MGTCLMEANGRTLTMLDVCWFSFRISLNSKNILKKIYVDVYVHLEFSPSKHVHINYMME